MFYIRFILATLGFAAALAYGAVLALLRRDRSRVLYDTARAAARLMLPPLGLRVEVHGAAHLYERRPCIYIANHQGLLEIPVLARIYPPDTILIGKVELLRYPLFGWLFTATGNIPVDRSDTRQAVAALHGAEAAIRQRGVSVWIFPEGTWGRVPGRLLPFKKGAFEMAVATGAPLVPVVVSPLAPLFDLRARRLRPGTVEIRVLEPIPTAGRADGDADALRTESRARMQAALRALAAPPGGG